MYRFLQLPTIQLLNLHTSYFTRSPIQVLQKQICRQKAERILSLPMLVQASPRIQQFLNRSWTCCQGQGAVKNLSKNGIDWGYRTGIYGFDQKSHVESWIRRLY